MPLIGCRKVAIVNTSFFKHVSLTKTLRMTIKYTVNIYRHVIGKNNVIGINR